MPTERTTSRGGPTEPSVPLAERYDALFVDLDGVVYRGERAVPGSGPSLEAIRGKGIPVLFLTNNSARTPEQVVAKLEAVGVEAKPSEILTSALATAAMLSKEFPVDGGDPPTAFVIGEKGVREALGSVGIAVVDGEPHRTDLVVVGWDRGVDYSKLRTAALLVQRGARLVATNSDASYPAPDGFWPGAGALLAVVTTATGATPTIVGKPYRPLFQAASELTGARRPLVVGDRLDTDVAGADGMGWDSLLVLTGTSGPEDLARAGALPTYVGADLSFLLEEVPPARFRVAVPEDEPGIGDLLERSGLSGEGLAERISSTLVLPEADHGLGGQAPPGASLTGAILATACLQDPEGRDGAAILRSVAVGEKLRGKGIGMLAVAAALRWARARGFRQVSLFTDTAPGFFQQLGFRRVRRDELPESVGTSAHALQECAVSAVPMVLEL